MAQAMNGGLSIWIMRLGWLVARAYQVIGASGVVGLLLLLAAAVTLGAAWVQHRAEVVLQSARLVPAGLPVVARVDNVARVKAGSAVDPVLSSADELALLQKQIEWAAVTHGLLWPQAEYRLNAATEQLPATLEVRCAFRGSYLGVRAFVRSLLRDVPGLTFREFGLSRPSSEAPEVEAKLTLVVFLADAKRPASSDTFTRGIPQTAATKP